MSVHVSAEIGSSHMGSLELALSHIRKAKECGSDSVKFQLFRGDSLEFDRTKRIKRQPYELPLHWLPVLKAESQKLGLLFGVTPFAIDLVEPLRGVVDFVKIAALDMGWDDLVIAAASLDVPLIVSVAMADQEEIEHMVDLIDAQDFNNRLVLLHGVTHYPAELEEMNLLKIRQLSEDFYEEVGLSDHTLGTIASMIATAMGACWLEKHFILSDHEYPQMQSAPDYPHSLQPYEFAYMVKQVRAVESSLGDSCAYGPLPSEMELYEMARRSNPKPLRR